MDQKQFIKSLEAMGNEKGISSEAIVESIKEAFKITFNKKFEDECAIYKPRKKRVLPKKEVKLDENGQPIKEEKEKLADALIRCDIDIDKGTINIFRQWKVVNEDDLSDDFVEVSFDDVKDKGFQVGDFYEEKLNFDTFTKGDVTRFITAFRQCISRAEKDALLETFSGKIGDLVTGVVEKSDPHSVIVNLGRVSVTLFQKDLIGRETFKVGDSIKVYICGISKEDTNKNASLIHCSRSCSQFLQKLFENEVREIYDGTVKIYKVARLAGNRSKVAVYSDDPNVDASGACIGQSGSRIQTIVSQLGNDRNCKEKIDIVQYSPNLGVFLRECLKPGVVIGANIDDENKTATVICGGDTGSAAIGFKGANVVLARILTGYDISVLDDELAAEKGVTYTTMAEFEAQEKELEKEKYRQESIKMAENETKKQVEVEKKPEEFLGKDDDEENEDIEDISTAEAAPINKVVEENKVEVTPKEEVKEAAPVEEPVAKVEPVKEEVHDVKTTTTLESLEKTLEEEKKENSNKGTYHKKFKKTWDKQNHEEDGKKVEEDVSKPKTSKVMPVYTEEELKQMEEEEKQNSSSESEDYSEYDNDEYYDK
ncbi:MAG: transcription termination factor NusA [Bacilli bacterium]